MGGVEGWFTGVWANGRGGWCLAEQQFVGRGTEVRRKKMETLVVDGCRRLS